MQELQTLVARQQWYFRFSDVKLDLFDRLLLVLYTPRGIFIYWYRGSAGISTNGEATLVSGHRIYFYRPRHEQRRDVALDAILEKLDDSGCELMALVDWSQ